MVSKLSFKGDKKKKKKRSHTSSDQRLTPKKHQSKSTKQDSDSETENANLIYINNKIVNIEDVDSELFDSGWTTASSISDLNGPILILLQRNGTVGCLTCINNDKFVISKEDTLDIVDPEQVVNFTVPDLELSVNTEAEIQRVEPTITSQVFTVVNVDHFVKLTSNDNAITGNDTSKSTVLKRFALKNSSGRYVSFDTANNELTTTDVLTENEIFLFKLRKKSMKDTLSFEISVGKLEANNKLIVTDDLKIKVIQDEDDLLNDLNQFVVRLQTGNSSTSRRVLAHLDEVNKNRGLIYDNSRDNELLNNSVKDLMKSGIKVTNSTLNKLKVAIEDGNLNEYLITLKEKSKTDRRA